MYSDLVIALIDQHGLEGLCRFDGCPCSAFELHHISVEISCRKSAHSLRVYTGSLDHDPDGLEAVAIRVLEALDGLGVPAQGYKVRYCMAKDDLEVRCSWCHAEKKPGGYLCEACKLREEALDRYPWGLTR